MFDSGNDSIDLTSKKKLVRISTQTINPVVGSVSSWYVGESRLVGAQQAAVVFVQHMQLVVSVQQVQPLTNGMRAQPMVGGHIHSLLANIDILTFGSW